MLEKPNFNNEFRLGLVLYGGVSLAIYMNGICREFYNAVRGRGIYKLIKALTDSDIVVDIISGTSAGGINGVLLSYALTNSNQDKVIDFDQFADIWRNTGDINKLMREVDRPNSQEEVNSVLDGEGYYQDQLCKAFETGGNKRSKAPQGEWYSDFRELDLFVTGTDILGKISTEFDHNSKLIEIKNHRVVFHLQHRRDRREDKYTPFKPNDKITSEALAKLCRITSCFPLAFPVVTVKLKEKESDTTLVDKKLVEWGQLEERQLPAKPPEKTGYQLHFVDGGVLDNRPFSYTTEAIYYRSAYRPVSRKLLYIDPNPESFLGSPEFQVMAKPNIWETVKDSLISLPSYESIGQDLQRIKEGNRKIRRYNNLRRIITQQIQPSSTESQPNKSLEHKRYLQCRFLGIVDRILSLIITTDTQSESARQKQEKNLEETAKLLTKYISEELDEEVYKISEKILNLDVQYAMR
ncbi:MAG: patatin-like protein, partial [Prochloraceae cyanobacterium]